MYLCIYLCIYLFIYVLFEFGHDYSTTITRAQLEKLVYKPDNKISKSIQINIP